MLRNFLVAIVLLVILFGMSFLIGVYSPQSSQGEVLLKGKSFSVSLADTPILQMKGLSGHKPLKSNEGMFFVFNSSERRNFWMKDMLFPLDIIWISADMKIIGLEKSLSPDTYPKSFGPDEPSQYVLEISAGQIDKLNIKIGDEVKFIKKI